MSKGRLYKVIIQIEIQLNPPSPEEFNIAILFKALTTKWIQKKKQIQYRDIFKCPYIPLKPLAVAMFFSGLILRGFRTWRVLEWHRTCSMLS